MRSEIGKSCIVYADIQISDYAMRIKKIYVHIPFIFEYAQNPPKIQTGYFRILASEKLWEPCTYPPPTNEASFRSRNNMELF